MLLSFRAACGDTTRRQLCLGTNFMQVTAFFKAGIVISIVAVVLGIVDNCEVGFRLSIPTCFDSCTSPDIDCEKVAKYSIF